MKILHFTPSFFPAIGGIETVVNTLTSEMALDTREVIVVCLTKKCISSFNCSYSTSDKLVSVYYFTHIDLLRYNKLLSLVKLLRSSDVIHIHDPKFALLFILAFIFARHKNLFMSTHGGFFHTKRFLMMKRLYSRLWVPFALKQFTKVFAISKNDFLRFSRLSPVNNVLYSPNPVDLNPFNVNPFAHPKSLRRWLYWGRVSKNKNLFGLLDLIRYMNQNNVMVSLNICSRDSLESLKSYAKKNNLDNVVFHQNSSDENISSLITASSVFVLPSTYEGFGLTVVEAASSGLIPFVNDISPVNSLFCDNIGLSVDFKNFSKVVESFLLFERNFSQNPDLSRVVNSCSLYSPSNVVLNIIKEYESPAF